MKFNINYKKEPNILVISNNPFSKTNNNGKTLASFFKIFPSENIAQLYFNEERPSETYFTRYYQISDYSVLNTLFRHNIKLGNEVKPTEDTNSFVNFNRSNFYLSKLKGMIIKSSLMRIIRELIWKYRKGGTEQFINWIESFSPDIIFFCAGDSEFAYDITLQIKEKFSSKLVVYITDDYILPRQTVNPFWWFRRNRLLKKIKHTLIHSDLFFTISPPMRETYKRMFGADSIVIQNLTRSLKDSSVIQKKSNQIELIYAGGLHLNRYKSLIILAKALKKFNEENIGKLNKQVYLKIYSSNIPSTDIIDKLNISGVSSFCGSVDTLELKKILNNCDIPVHVESFDKKSKESTKLSISTKIPEYLSLGKPILAFGPKDIASMKYLEDVAYCINSPTDINQKLKQFLVDEELKNELSRKSEEKFKKKHNQNKSANFFKQQVTNLVYECNS